MMVMVIDDVAMRMKEFCSKASGLLQERKDLATHHLEHSSTGISFKLYLCLYSYFYHDPKLSSVLQ